MNNGKMTRKAAIIQEDEQMKNSGFPHEQRPRTTCSRTPPFPPPPSYPNLTQYFMLPVVECQIFSHNLKLSQTKYKQRDEREEWLGRRCHAGGRGTQQVGVWPFFLP